MKKSRFRVRNILLEKQYSRPVPICDKKKKDILSMFGLIDPIYHDFYSNFITKNIDFNDDPDLEIDISN
jgi:hypothetical protein